MTETYLIVFGLGMLAGIVVTWYAYRKTRRLREGLYMWRRFTR
jgi:hypothetical protein